MLTGFDWLRRSRTGAELLATLKYLEVKPDLFPGAEKEIGPPHSALDGPCQYLEAWSPRHPAGIRILDMGCGTGKQLAADQRAFPELSPIGLDRYLGMLRLARERSPTIPWVNGDNTWAPLASQSFAYITNQFSYHHVPNKARLIGETLPLLQPGGRFVITNLDPWSMPGWCKPLADGTVKNSGP